ncbi:MAG: SpoIIIAH-like family protein [Oscillospiraceae bacterium]|nr:SpoIIIAH-like family protein [Oscillospiraceae bacterium]
MKKPTVIIGKKQIVLTCMSLVLCGAVYLNYTLAGDKGLLPTGNDNNVSDADAEQPQRDDYGAAELVNGSTGSDYFAKARLEKQTSRDTAVETLQSIIGGGDLSEDELVVNAIDAVGLSQLIESESVIESLILAQGFSDCVVYLDGNGAKVVVESDGLNASEAAAIKDIILSETEVSAEGIRIFEVTTVKSSGDAGT